MRLDRSDFGALVAGVVGEAARNPELAESFRAFWQRRRAVAATLVRDVVGATLVADELDLLLDRLLAPLYYRLLLTQEPITDEFLWGLVTEIPWTIGPGLDAWGSDHQHTEFEHDPVGVRADGAH